MPKVSFIMEDESLVVLPVTVYSEDVDDRCARGWSKDNKRGSVHKRGKHHNTREELRGKQRRTRKIVRQLKESSDYDPAERFYYDEEYSLMY